VRRFSEHLQAETLLKLMVTLRNSVKPVTDFDVNA